MDKLHLLKQASFGARVAEDEASELATYFVETDQWTRIARGEIDVIRGEKGAGKSAIYSLLMNRVDDFFDRNILLVAAERPHEELPYSKTWSRTRPQVNSSSLACGNSIY